MALNGHFSVTRMLFTSTPWDQYNFTIQLIAMPYRQCGLSSFFLPMTHALLTNLLPAACTLEGQRIVQIIFLAGILRKKKYQKGLSEKLEHFGFGN